jgi:hypothetical protein
MLGMTAPGLRSSLPDIRRGIFPITFELMKDRPGKCEPDANAADKAD